MIVIKKSVNHIFYDQSIQIFYAIFQRAQC
jgi:hypothetical protein